MKYLTSDELRVLKDHINALNYDVDSYQDAILDSQQTSYVKNFKPVLDGCIKDTITQLYIIVKDTGQGDDPYGQV